jgi:hypothetical protein
MITTIGRNAQRDLWQGLLSTVVIGTGTRPENEGDTALQAQVITKPASLATRSTGEVVASGRLTAGDANGLLLAEVGVKTADNRLLSRKTFLQLEKNETIEVEFEVLYRVRNP